MKSNDTGSARKRPLQGSVWMPLVLQRCKGAKYREHTGKFSPGALPLDEHAVLPPACLPVFASVTPKEKTNATITRSLLTAISIEPLDGLTTLTGKVQPQDDISSLAVLEHRSASAIQVTFSSHVTAPFHCVVLSIALAAQEALTVRSLCGIEESSFLANSSERLHPCGRMSYLSRYDQVGSFFV
jgi:hypothetical protein